MSNKDREEISAAVFFKCASKRSCLRAAFS
jgi:hypothetical protein